MKKHEIGLIIVDYLQLGVAPNLNNKSVREQEVSKISKGLKGIAKELEIPLIALSQMNRDQEKLKRKPILSDLRESGAIEQDADLVMFIWNEFIENTVRNNLIIAKHRNGKTDDIEVKFSPAIMKWSDKEDPRFANFQPFNPYQGESRKNWTDEEF